MIVILKKALRYLASLCRKLLSSFTGLHNDDHSDITSEDEVFPLRVINVRDTLALARGVCFSVPKNWNFHVISHTWSMKVRDWSIEIAAEIDGQTGGQEYNELFQNADFHERPYFHDFLKFLEMLASDGVEKVWFDALCINQTDLEEKSREILHMGRFYSQSLGCYVLTHGLGQGYGLLSKDGQLPRWFSRVWTLQEFLLPKELWFIVELNAETVQKANPYPKSDCRKYFRELVNVGLSNLYFVNRMGYESLLWQELGVLQTEESERQYLRSEEEVVEFKARLESFWNLPRRTWIEDCWVSSEESMVKVGHISREVAFRDCSEGHEEDRVLCILALLGIEGKLRALRVGKSLDQQMLDLFTQLVEADQRLFLAMCAASVIPYPRPGMSWCPHFFRMGFSHWFNSPPSLDEKAQGTQVMEVSENGLKLSCRFLRAQFLSLKEHKNRCTAPLRCISCTQDFSFSWVLEIQVGDSGSILTLPFLDVSEQDSLMFLVNPFECTTNPRLKFLYEQSGLVLNLEQRIDSLEFLPHFHPWLLLLGYKLYYEEDLTSSISSLLFMVCIGLCPENLHKVGLLKVEEKNFGPGWDLMLHSWYHNQSPEDVFTVGGFGMIPVSQLQTDDV